MRVLLFGGTGNLGSRVIPALLFRGHTVIASVRSPKKLQELLPQNIISRITIHHGDAYDSSAVAETLRGYSCDAVINTAGTREPAGHEQTLGKIVASISSAAVQVGKEGGKPLRAWFIGGMGSLKWPGTDRQIQDFMPKELTDHHRGTEMVVRGIATSDLKWSLLCVAMMRAENKDIREMMDARPHELTVRANRPPGPQSLWSGDKLVDEGFLDLGFIFREYTTNFEDVADLLAVEIGEANFVGDFVGLRSLAHAENKDD